MTTKMKNYLSFLTIFIFFMAAIASSAAKHGEISVAKGQIPPEFNKFSDTLLIISKAIFVAFEDYDKSLIKNFKNNYTGNYLFIKRKDLDNYPPEKYRYVFDAEPRWNSSQIGSGGSIIYVVRDRVSKKDYTSVYTTAYKNIEEDYIKALEEARHK